MMKIKSIKLYVIIAGLSVAVSMSLYSSYHFGRRTGLLDGQIKRIPFDLITYIKMYEMSSYIHSSSETMSAPTLSPGSSKLLIYSTIQFYDVYKERFERIGEANEFFEENMEYARTIVENLELTTLRDVLYEYLDQADKLPRTRDD